VGCITTVVCHRTANGCDPRPSIDIIVLFSPIGESIGFTGKPRFGLSMG
jgi:hypothetical protein